METQEKIRIIKESFERLRARKIVKTQEILQIEKNLIGSSSRETWITM